MRLDELPTWTPEVISAARGRGRFTPSRWIASDRDGCLVLPSERVLWGRFRDVEPETRRCSFELRDELPAEPLEVGHAYPYLDGYWGERAELVLDRARAWRREAFVARPATRVGNAIRRSTSADDPRSVLVDGWDHEHCAICGEKIGTGGVAEGFRSSHEETWLCEACHSHVVARSLDFIPSSDA